MILYSDSSVDHHDLHSFPTRRSSDLRRRPDATGEPGREPALGGRHPGEQSRQGTLRALRGVPRSSGEGALRVPWREDRKSTRLNSSHVEISYAVFCLKKKNEVILVHV